MSGSWYQRRSTRQLWGVQRHLQRGMILSNVYWMSSHVQIYLGQTLKLKILIIYLYLIVTISVVLFVLLLCVKTEEEKSMLNPNKQLLSFSLCCTFVQRTEGKFVNRVPLQRNLLPVSSEREINWRLKKTLLFSLWNFHILWGKFWFELLQRLQIQVCTDQICSWEGKQGKSSGNMNPSAKKKERYNLKQIFKT